MTYDLSREKTAEILNISTRTLDRWIRKWVLSHQKKWNKVLLSEEEVKNYNNKEQVENIVIDTKVDSATKHWNLKKEIITPNIDTKNIVKEIGQHMDESMNRFIDILSEKDKTIENKNNLILWLQQKNIELEVKVKNTIALPLYEEEKKEIILEKENLKIENKLLEEKVKKEKITNIALMWIVILVIILIIFISK